MSLLLYTATQVHDIEDLTKVGKEQKACPYYAATHFAGSYLGSLLRSCMVVPLPTGLKCLQPAAKPHWSIKHPLGSLQPQIVTCCTTIDTVM